MVNSLKLESKPMLIWALGHGTVDDTPPTPSHTKKFRAFDWSGTLYPDGLTGELQVSVAVAENKNKTIYIFLMGASVRKNDPVLSQMKRGLRLVRTP